MSLVFPVFDAADDVPSPTKPPATGQMPLLLIECASLADAGAADFVRAWAVARDHARARRFRTPLRREQCLMARALLRHLLARMPGCSRQAVMIAHDANGRPYPVGQAMRGINVSLSHSGSMVVAAVCDFGPVGIDVEDTTKQRDFSQIEAFLPGGRRRAADRPHDPIAFYLGWTTHEAFIKLGRRGWYGTPETAARTTPQGRLSIGRYGADPYILGSRLVGTHAMSVAVLPTTLPTRLPSLRWSSILAMPLAGVRH